jgi:chromosome segregation ATPase
MQGQPFRPLPGRSERERSRVTTVDEILSVKSKSDLHGELDSLESRLAQGRRDHQRSGDELRLLEGEIRRVEGELRSLPLASSHLAG